MATLNEIIYNIAEQKGLPDDAVLLSRLKFIVGYYRAQFIRQDQRRNHSLPSQFVQSLDCLEMESSSSLECCNGVDIGCDVWRSKKTIPRPVRIFDGSEFSYVGTGDGKQPYQRTTTVQADYARYNKYTSNIPQYIYTKDRIYVLNARPSKVMVKGIFEQPEELEGYVCCDGTSVFTADKEYPMSMDMVQRVTQSILATEMQLQNPTDDGEEVQLSE